MILKSIKIKNGSLKILKEENIGCMEGNYQMVK